jgi:hypothetical protein
LSETQRHVQLLRAGLPDTLVTPLWQSEGKSSRYARSAVGAAGVAAGMVGDVYVSVGVLTEETVKKLGRGNRVTEAVTAGLSGLAIDLDVAGSPDGRGGMKRTGAPSLEAAIVASKLLAEPTLTVGSGYGVQPWWLFREGPLLFSSAEEREPAKLACARWQEAHRRAAGFAVNSTHDLAHVFRLAGTTNYKGGGAGVPVTILEDNGPRYSFAELAAMVAEIPVTIAGAEQLQFNGEPPEERVRQLIAQLCEDRGFRSLWERKPDRFAGDGHRYDFHIARACVAAGLDDDEVRAVGIANRLLHTPHTPKLGREDYWARTIARVRASSNEDGSTRASEDFATSRNLRGESDAEPAAPLRNRERPRPPRSEAFYGLAGEIARAIEPHTESDPVAILSQVLLLAGSAMGTSARFRVEGDLHGTKLFVVVVGETSRGRKGTSLRQSEVPIRSPIRCGRTSANRAG